MEKLEDYVQKKIDRLIKLGVSIANIYDNLSRLEKEEQKGSPLFQKYVSYLEIGTEIENQRFRSITRNEEEMNTILCYLEEKYNLYGVDAYYDFVYFDNETRAAVRIMETLETALDNIEDYDDMYDDEYDDYEVPVNAFKMYSMLNKTNIYYNLILMDQDMSELVKDNTHNIGEEYVKQLKDLYLDYKYNMAFVDKDIEKSFIINNFNVKDLMVLSLQQQAKSSNVSYNDYMDEKYYSMAHDVFTKIIIYGDYSKVELLLPSNYKRKNLTLWHLNNTLDLMGYNQLKEVEDFLALSDTTKALTEKDKKIVLKMVNNSMDKVAPIVKTGPNDDEKTYKKKK